MGLAIAGPIISGFTHISHVLKPAPPDLLGAAWLDRDHKGVVYGLLTGTGLLSQGAELEQAVWFEHNYGDLVEEGYEPFMATGRTFGAFVNGCCVGIGRVFGHAPPHALPCLSGELPFSDTGVRERLAAAARSGTLEELGTVAVSPQCRRQGVNLRLYRLAYRDAVTRGVTHWAIIMEPERVQRMNQQHAFTFEQLGPAVWYQGGECAVHVMDLRKVYREMRLRKPVSHFWFVRIPLRGEDCRRDRRRS